MFREEREIAEALQSEFLFVCVTRDMRYDCVIYIYMIMYIYCYCHYCYHYYCYYYLLYILLLL